MTTLPKPIRWGVIGIGRFGRLHAKTVQSIFGLELTAICNRNAERLAAASREFGGVAAEANYKRLLDDPSIDVVSITTHWQDHFEVALAALQAGKHVLLEKPMASTSDECQQLVETAKSSRGKLMVGHICRFDPRVTLAKQAIDEGRIGRVVSMHAKRNLPQAPGSLRLDKTSPLMGDGIHDADLMMWLIGRPPSRVYARNVRFNEHRYPDIGWAMLEFEDAALGVIETNWGLPENTPTVIDATLQVVGTDGMLTVDCSQTGLTLLDAGGLKMQDTDYWPEQNSSIVGVLRNEISYFADCIRRGRDFDVVTPLEAARAVRVMEAAERSAREGVPIALK